MQAECALALATIANTPQGLAVVCAAAGEVVALLSSPDLSLRVAAAHLMCHPYPDATPGSVLRCCCDLCMQSLSLCPAPRRLSRGFHNIHRVPRART